MKENTRRKAAGRQYAKAHKEHYTTKDLRRALALYRNIMANHPDSPEAAWSRTQIQNIAQSVVPGQELLDDQAQLALGHLDEAEHRSAAQASQLDAPDETEDGVARARHNGEQLRRRMAMRGH